MCHWILACLPWAAEPPPLREVAALGYDGVRAEGLLRDVVWTADGKAAVALGGRGAATVSGPEGQRLGGASGWWSAVSDDGRKYARWARDPLCLVADPAHRPHDGIDVANAAAGAIERLSLAGFAPHFGLPGHKWDAPPGLAARNVFSKSQTGAPCS